MIFPLSTANQVFPIPSWIIIMFLIQVAFLGLYPMIEQITKEMPMKQNDVNINGKDSSLNQLYTNETYSWSNNVKYPITSLK